MNYDIIVKRGKHKRKGEVERERDPVLPLLSFSAAVGQVETDAWGEE